MENDGLPSQVCLQCVHYITRAFSFKQLCERSDSTLRQLLGKPTQATFMELKPLLSNEQHESSFSDVINTVSENIHVVTNSVNEVLSDAVLETVDVNNVAEGSEDLKMKLEFVENEILGNDAINEKVKRESKKKKVKDDTEQPIYPCEECTQCFTTMIDLKAHAKTHPKISRHICKTCNQGFASASTLCRHMKVLKSFFTINN